MSTMRTTPDPAILGAALHGTVPAPVGRRVGASLIDSGLTILIEVVAFGLANGAGASPVLIVTVAILGWGFVQWRLHATSGQTIGKRAVAIRTLAVPGGDVPGWGRTFGRYLLLAVAAVIPAGSLLVVLSVFWDGDRLLRGWHDKAAGVFLIDLRAGRDPVAPEIGAMVVPTPQPPAPVRPWAETPLAAPVDAHPGPGAAFPDPVTPSVVRVAPASTPAPPALGGPQPSAQSSLSAGSGAGIISAVPGLSAPGQSAPAGLGAAPPPPPPPPAAFVARPFGPAGGVPFSPPPAPPNAADDDDDDAELTMMSPAAAAPVAAVRLVFDTGDLLPVAGRGRIGRDPVVGGEPVSHLVPLADSSRSVSKTHLEFVLGDGGLWVCDLHSTNGSSIERAGVRTPMQPGEWVRAESGTVVHLGSRTFRVEAQ
ncbi:RDD family protein [Pengzhenrongella sicca]|uniref:RDD family protein n=1 Tax=Pengzhenrongella sicca TaxID=2819238 RepID=A0A8A4ZDM0_9MICO|nr:RDD family protein [Pengzhenrongella sicca]QTE28993.1 RDD family protein [Pengzhenrongella sicca]